MPSRQARRGPTEAVMDREMAVPALETPRSYDEFLGRFVDAVQAGERGFERLQMDWLDACPQDWRQAFARAQLPGGRLVDRRIPSRVLSCLWSRTGRPTFETLAGGVDLTHSPTPLALPSRRAARVVTVHDLFFLRSAGAARGEVARDWV